MWLKLCSEKWWSLSYMYGRSMDVHVQLPMQSVPITTNVMSLSPAHGKVYLIQHYVMEFVSNL
jgi:hypothetical protein